MTASNLDFAFSLRRRFATWDRTVWSVTSTYTGALPSSSSEAGLVDNATQFTTGPAEN